MGILFGANFGPTLASAALLQLPIMLPGLLFIVALRRGCLLRLNHPIDRGRFLGGKPIFGPNKTWRAPVFYVVGATLVLAGIQSLITQSPTPSDAFSVFSSPYWILGPAIGASYSLGELANSFVKRRLAVAAGGTATGGFSRFVQRAGDTVDGALLSGLVYLGFGAKWQVLAMSLIFTVIVHTSTDVLMHQLGLKQRHK